MVHKETSNMPPPRYEVPKKIEFDATKQFGEQILEFETKPIGILLDKWGMNFETP